MSTLLDAVLAAPVGGTALRPSGAAVERLMEGVARGDEEAFRALVDRYQRRVYRLALSYLRRHEDALDVAQETFVRIYRARTRVHRDADPEGWILKIASNLCIDQHRRRRRASEEPLPEPESSGELPDRNALSPMEVAIERERELALAGALDRLAPRQRMVFVLRHYQQLSLEEISGALGCSVGTVKSSLHRAVSKLRVALGK